MKFLKRLYLTEGQDFKVLKKNKVPLTDKERQQVLKSKAIWHFAQHGGAPSPAVWKGEDAKGKIHFITNTHRAWGSAPTLKGAINKYHSFIKSTA